MRSEGSLAQVGKAHVNWLGFLIALLLFGVHVFTSKYQALYYDSDLYWRFAQGFEQSGHFSLYHFATGLRGYLYPLLNYPLTVLERDVLPGSYIEIIKAEGALIAALMFGVVGPQLWEATTRTPVSLGRRAAFILLGFLFWRDHFNFTLSDFPALLLLTAGARLGVGTTSPVRMFFAGALLIGSIYVRPVYLLAIPLIIIWLAYRQPADSRRLMGLRWTVFFLGMGLIILPQWLINQRNFQSSSPLVLSRSEGNQYTVAGKDNLYLWHLNKGITTQKYETNIGTSYPSAQVFYMDAAGKVLLATDSTTELSTMPDYLAFVSRYPQEMVALFCRHLFNGLDVLYSGPYLMQVYKPSIWLALVNYSVLFLGLALALRRLRHVRPADWLLLGALVLPALASVPLVVECRFFLSLHVLFYGIACFGWPMPASWRMGWVRRAPLLVAYSVFVVLCITFSANTRASLEAPIPTKQP